MTIGFHASPEYIRIAPLPLAELYPCWLVRAAGGEKTAIQLLWPFQDNHESRSFTL